MTTLSNPCSQAEAELRPFKTCSKCAFTGRYEEFLPKTNIFLPCIKAHWREYYRANRVRILASMAAKQKEARPARLAYERQFAKDYPEKIRGWARDKYHADPGKHHAKNARRKAQKLRAIPPWADLAEIKKVYDVAAQKTLQTGVIHNVDHIVPLIHKSVCGLHCEANLQVLTKSANSSKGNRHWPDQPEAT